MTRCWVHHETCGASAHGEQPQIGDLWAAKQAGISEHFSHLYPVLISRELRW